MELCGQKHDIIYTVILTSWAPWTPHFWPYHTLDWLYTVPVMIKVFRKPVDLLQWFVLLHHIKRIKKRLVFWCTPLNFYQCVLSLGSIHQQCKNNPSRLRQSTYLCKLMKILITNSEINSLGTLNTTFTTFLHARLTLYSTGDNQGGQKTVRFTAAVWPPSLWEKNRQTPGLQFLPCYFGSKYQITPAVGKSLIHTNKWTIRSPAVVLTSQALLMPSLDWLYTVLVMIKVVGKTVDLPQWFVLLHDGKRIDKRLVIRCYPLTLAWYFCSFDVTHFGV